mgnify:CR=1 FL=1
MAHPDSLAAEKAGETAERIENTDSMDELDPLDVKVELSLGSREPTVSSVMLVLTVGGPHVELNATNGTVSVSWGGDHHTTHVNNEALCDEIHDFYARQMRDHYLA